jgi:hypothetical protein
VISSLGKRARGEDCSFGSESKQTKLDEGTTSNPVSPESVSEAFLEKELPIVDTPESLLPDIDLAETHQLTLAEYDSNFPLETDFISSYERKMYIIYLYDRIDETCLSIVEKCGILLPENYSVSELARFALYDEVTNVDVLNDIFSYF